MVRKKTEILTDLPMEPAANDTAPIRKERGGSGGVLFTCLLTNLVIVALIAGGVYLKRDKIYAKLQPAPVERSDNLLPEVATLKSRLSLLEQRLTAQEASLHTLQASVAAAPSAAGQTLADNQKLSQLEAETKTLRDQLQQMSTLQQGLSQQVQQQAAHTPPDMRLVALFQSLRAKALEGEAFQHSFQRFLAVAQPYPVLTEAAAPLEIYASSGRPLLADLQRSFQESLKEYLKNKEGVDHSLSGKIKRNLADFITIRKLDDSGDSPLASINRAEKAATAGHLEQAVTELGDLPPDTAPFFSAWVEEAKAYYLIPQLIQKLDQHLADVVMQASSGAPHAP